MNNEDINKTNKKKYNQKIIILMIIILIVIVFLIELYLYNQNNNVQVSTNNQQWTYISYITEKSSFPTDISGITVNTQLLEIGSKARSGTKRKIKYIVIHETENTARGAGAKNHSEYLRKNSTKSSTSWHYTVDDKEIYHHIPDNEIAYHAGTKIGNLYGIGVELCVNSDGNFDKTFNNATKLVAYLLKEYELTTDDIKTHHDFSSKDCPHNILENNRLEEFIEKVEELL